MREKQKQYSMHLYKNQQPWPLTLKITSSFNIAWLTMLGTQYRKRISHFPEQVQEDKPGRGCQTNSHMSLLRNFKKTCYWIFSGTCVSVILKIPTLIIFAQDFMTGGIYPFSSFWCNDNLSFLPEESFWTKLRFQVFLVKSHFHLWRIWN